jgi:hypothetical protein
LRFTARNIHNMSQLTFTTHTTQEQDDHLSSHLGWLERAQPQYGVEVFP